MSLFIHPWWRLLRVGNLLYLGILLFLLRFGIIVPLFHLASAHPSLSFGGFVLLVISILAAAAAGYVWNDVEDVETDKINKPHRVTIGQAVSESTALRAAVVLNVVAMASGFGAAYLSGNYKLGWIQVITVILLLQYARGWKKTALWGNILVALLAALAVLMPILFEQELFYALKDQSTAFILGILGYSSDMAQSPEANQTGMAAAILSYVLPYSAFAFLLTLVREIVKDAEDIEGDKKANYKTLPIVAGMSMTKLAALLPLLLSIQLIVQFMLRQLVNGDNIATIGGLVLILLPLLWYVWRLWKATYTPDFTILSRAAKGIMVLGLLYLPYLAMQLPNMSILPEMIQGSTDINTEGIPNDITITDIKIDTVIRTGDLAPGDTNITEQPPIIIGEPK